MQSSSPPDLAPSPANRIECGRERKGQSKVSARAFIRLELDLPPPPRPVRKSTREKFPAVRTVGANRHTIPRKTAKRTSGAERRRAAGLALHHAPAAEAPAAAEAASSEALVRQKSGPRSAPSIEGHAGRLKGKTHRPTWRRVLRRVLSPSRRENAGVRQN